MTGARMLESVIAAVAGPDGVEAYVAAMLQDRYKRSDQSGLFTALIYTALVYDRSGSRVASFGAQRLTALT